MRSPNPAPMPSRSDRRCWMARSRRPRGRCAARSWTFSRRATQRPGSRRERRRTVQAKGRERWQSRAASPLHTGSMIRTAAAPDTLGQLLRGEWPDPDDGTPILVPVLAVAIERSLAGLEAELVAPLRLGRRIAVVSDATTRAVLGETRRTRTRTRCHHCAGRARRATPCRRTDRRGAAPCVRRTRMHWSQWARERSTISANMQRRKDGKPYAVFATAPSMNGYTSKNAAITVDGHKKSLPSVPPVGVFMDLAVLSAAPARMIRAGLGDSLCRSTAQADWLLSHHLFGTPYRRAPFALLAEDEPALLDDPEALLRGDRGRDACARAHAGTLRPWHDHLRRQLSGESGRASDQPLHRHVRASPAAQPISMASRWPSPR